MKISKVEIIKKNSGGLRGSLTNELRNESNHFSNEGYELLKFHGVYQQDDRDLRQQLKREGKSKKYIFMIRTKNPGGGEITPGQWEIVNEVSDLYTDGTIRLTNRQDIQLHGVGKNNIKNAIKHLNTIFISTKGACGDVNRNTVASTVSDIKKGSKFNAQKWAKKISDHLSYKSNSYNYVWLDGKNKAESETIYGNTYLPRKFKIGIALPDDNSLDIHTHDIGIIPIIKDKLEGFNILIGGGLGSHHNLKHTFPRLSNPLAFVTPDKLLDVITKIVEFQRDHGNRVDRKLARFKYVVEKIGVKKIKKELENSLNYKLPNAKKINIYSQQNHLGWYEQNTPGQWFVGIFIENGRIKDDGDLRVKTGLREIVKKYNTGVRITPLQDIVLTNISEELIHDVNADLLKYGIKNKENYSTLRINSMSCPALPTCGLALAESERYLPILITQLENRGYGEENITIRMSGCANACSRPSVAEIGIMGVSPKKYNIYLGGNNLGTKLNKLYDQLVSEDELPDKLCELVDVYRKNKLIDEKFGDFCNRIGIDNLSVIIQLNYREKEPAREDSNL